MVEKILNRETLKSGHIVVVPVRGVLVGIMVANDSSKPETLKFPSHIVTQEDAVKYIIGEATEKGFSKVDPASSFSVVIYD